MATGILVRIGRKKAFIYSHPVQKGKLRVRVISPACLGEVSEGFTVVRPGHGASRQKTSVWPDRAETPPPRPSSRPPSRPASRPLSIRRISSSRSGATRS